MNDDATKVLPQDITSKAIMAEIKSAIKKMNELGYNGVQQMTQFLVSGEPLFLTSKEGIRRTISAYDRSDLIEVIIANIKLPK